jgi:ankyrin repeat protein
MTALYWAIVDHGNGNNIEMAKLLLDSTADVNAVRKVNLVSAP